MHARSDQIRPITSSNAHPYCVQFPSLSTFFPSAKLLRDYAETAKEDLCIIMRVYFEKPRTTVGWKGLINDPLLNHRYDVPAIVF